MLSPLAIEAVHHIAVTTTNAARSATFYREVLGFQDLDRPGFSFGGAWLYHPGSDLQIHVIEHPAAREPEGGIDTRADHFAMVVADLDKAEAQLKEHGVAYHRQINAGGYLQIFFRDPDGHHIEVGVYPPTVLPS